MTRINRKLLAYVLIILFTLSPHVSGATSLSLSAQLKGTLKLEAGLDPSTRALIEGMPKEVREQALQLLRDALPLIDESVAKYLGQVDAIMTRQLATIDCSLTGLSKTTIEELLAGLKFWKDGPTMVEDLRNRANALPGRFKWTSTPEDYRVFYGDVLQASRTVACANKDTKTAYEEAMRIRLMLTSEVLPFERMRGLQCKDPAECTNLLKLAVAEKLGTLDSRDVASANAQARLDKVVLPKKPWAILSKFDQAEYVDGLQELYAVQNELLMLSVIRVTRFEANLTQGRVALSSLTSRLASAKQANRSSNGAMTTAVSTLSGVAGEELSVVRKALDEADALIPERRREADELRTNIDAVVLEAKSSVQLFSNQLAELRRQLKSECDDYCGGGRNELCPNRRPPKTSDCR